MATKKKSTIERYRSAGRAKRLKARAKKLRQIPPNRLLELLPKDVMEELAEQTGVDVQVKRLFGPVIVMLFILAVLNDKDQTLDSLAALYNSTRFSAFSGKGGHKTSKSSLSCRLSTMNLKYVKAVYDSYIEALGRKYGKALGKKGGWLARFDSTMLALCASLTDIGMRVGSKPKKGQGKVQIKVTLGLRGILPSKVKIFHKQSMLPEERALKAAIEAGADGKAGGAIVFDMGLKSRKSFNGFDSEGRMFVTRLKAPRHETVRAHSRIKGRRHGSLRFLSDEIVHLHESGQGAGSLVEHEFRLVAAECERGRNAGKTFYFLTNILDVGAFEIADIYQRRWDIEVFFRFLKQEVGLRSLLSTNENGIKAVIYLRLLVGTMIWAYAHLNKRQDYKKMKREFYEEVDWQLTVAMGQLIYATGITERSMLIPDFHGIMAKD